MDSINNAEMTGGSMLPSQQKGVRLYWYSLPVSWIASLKPRQGCGPVISKPECTCLRVIAACLLDIGGQEVCLIKNEPPLIQMNLVTSGRTMHGNNVVLKPGDPHRCHQNCAHLWARNRGIYRIVSGYALDNLGETWRSHTWLLDNQDCIVETTVVAKLYRGRVLSDQEAEEFSKSEP